MQLATALNPERSTHSLLLDADDALADLCNALATLRETAVPVETSLSFSAETWAELREHFGSLGITAVA